ncbi:DUF4158 domain-containing protein [Paraburkholderia sp. JPY465]|uniref:DUF4158 domain-containing protein n=1 Tax=Paraburkholderia sp. JPY465 TaxID=3042285 RepID=UPI003D1CC809
MFQHHSHSPLTHFRRVSWGFLLRVFHSSIFSRSGVSGKPGAVQYAQRRAILALSGYRLWSEQDRSALALKAAQLVRRDVTPVFVLTEFIVWLNQQHIVRPGYTVLQAIVSTALSTERQRLGDMVEAALTKRRKPRCRACWCATSPCPNWPRSARTRSISAPA